MEGQISHPNYVNEILKLFCQIAQRLEIDFAPYIQLIQKAIKRNRLQSEAFDRTVE